MVNALRPAVAPGGEVGSGRASVTARAACVVALIAGLAAGWPSPASAQQRPLVTEDPQPVGAGRIAISGGFEWGSGETFPASGLKGDSWRIPVDLRFGLSSLAELEIATGFQGLGIDDRFDAPFSGVVTSSDSTSAVLDVVVATKVRFLEEAGGRPALGLRFATRLPNASNESGLGLDTTDFLATFLIGKSIGAVRVAGNVGMGILGDPTRGDSQNDVLLYGVSIAGALSKELAIVGEAAGRKNTAGGTPPPGTESRGQARVGVRYTRGAATYDGAVTFGLTDLDASPGFVFGVTYVFDAFKVP